MNISPVTFGRAIRINTKDKEVAQRIADIANMTNYEITKPSTEEGKALQKYLENIFNDTHLPNGRARVVSSQNGDIYIFSGKEGSKAFEIAEKTKEKIRENKEFVESLPDRYCREYQRRHYAVLNQQLFADRNRHILSLVEDGNKNPQKSLIDVKCSTIQNPDDSKVTFIDQIIYTSSNADSDDIRIFDRENI